MTEQYIGWALVVGIVLGAALLWFVLGRLPRHSDDIGSRERALEAEWISRTIESRGGVAPEALVEEVLELHTRYLDRPPLDVPRQQTAPPVAVGAEAAPVGTADVHELRGEPPAGGRPGSADRSELADEDGRAV